MRYVFLVLVPTELANVEAAGSLDRSWYVDQGLIQTRVHTYEKQRNVFVYVCVCV